MVRWIVDKKGLTTCFYVGNHCSWTQFLLKYVVELYIVDDYTKWLLPCWANHMFSMRGQWFIDWPRLWNTMYHWDWDFKNHINRWLKWLSNVHDSMISVLPLLKATHNWKSMITEGHHSLIHYNTSGNSLTDSFFLLSHWTSVIGDTKAIKSGICWSKLWSKIYKEYVYGLSFIGDNNCLVSDYDITCRHNY